MEQARKGLDAITKAANTARKTFRQQRDQMQLDPNRYTSQNKLTLGKVNTVVAILDYESKQAGLTHEQTDQLAQRIRRAGSLTAVIQDLQSRRLLLQSEVTKLTEVRHGLNEQCDRLVLAISELNKSLRKDKDMQNKLKSAVESLRKEYAELKEKVNFLLNQVQ